MPCPFDANCIINPALAALVMQLEGRKATAHTTRHFSKEA